MSASLLLSGRNLAIATSLRGRTRSARFSLQAEQSNGGFRKGIRRQATKNSHSNAQKDFRETVVRGYPLGLPLLSCYALVRAGSIIREAV
jgi:hypothetical protein